MSTERSRIVSIEATNWAKGSQFGKGLAPGMGDPTDFQAMNLQTYTNGSLGPRPYLKRDSISAGRYTSPLANGGAHAFHIANGIFTIMDSGQVTFYSAGWSALSAAFGVLVASGPVPQPQGWYALAEAPQILTIDASVMFVSGEYTFTPGSHTSGATVAWPGTFTPRAAVIWKDRVFGFDDSTVVNGTRVYYTDVYPNITTITSSAQFFDLGSRRIIGAFPLRDALIFVNDRGVMYTLTGNSPQTWSVREVGKLKRINGTNRPVVFRNAVWQLAQYGRGVVILTPDGQETELEWVRPTIDRNLYNAQCVPLIPAASDEFNAICFPFVGDNHTSFSGEVRPVAPYTGFQSIDYINDAFTWSKYWSSSSSASGYGMSLSDSTDARILGFQENNGVLWIAVDESRLPNNTTDGVVLYSRNLSLNRPSNSADYYSAAREELGGVYNDGGTSGTNQTAGELWLREFAPPPGNRVRVHRVIADVTYWDGATYLDPAITLDVYGNGASLATIAHTSAEHDLTNTSTGDTGAHGRIVWRPSPQPHTPTAQVRLTGINSVAIRRLVVEYEIQPLP